MGFTSLGTLFWVKILGVLVFGVLGEELRAGLGWAGLCIYGSICGIVLFLVSVVLLSLSHLYLS